MRRDVQWWVRTVQGRLSPTTVVNLIYVVLLLDTAHTIYWLSKLTK